jgi:hypothetical protein
VIKKKINEELKEKQDRERERKRESIKNKKVWRPTKEGMQ